MGARSPLLLAALAIAGCSEAPTGPRLVLEATSVDFGAVGVGEPHLRTVFVRNVGDAPLELAAPRLDPAQGPFEAGLVGQTVMPGERTLLEVRMLAATSGRSTAVVHLDSNEDRGLSPRVSVQGLATSGLGVEVSPQQLDFGAVVVDRPVRLPVTVHNRSDSELTIGFEAGANVARECGDRREVFCVEWGALRRDDLDRAPLPAGASLTVEVEVLAPVAEVRERGDFTLRTCESEVCEVTVSLDAIGVERGLHCEPLLVDFGRTAPGRCVDRSLTCENLAYDDVVIPAWQLAGPDPFEVEPSRVTTLERFETIDIELDYCPSQAGLHEGALEISTSEGPFTVRLQGESRPGGVQIVPEVIDFGEVSLLAPAQRALLVLVDGFEDVQLTSIDPDVDGTGAFSAPGFGPTTVSPGGSVSIPVEFLPVGVGPVQSTLRITTDDPARPTIEATLRGVGVDLASCQYELAPASVSYGVVSPSSIAERGVAIRNLGSQDCLVTGLALEPGSNPAFSLLSQVTQSVRIPAGDEYIVRTRYAPATPGRHRGAIEVALSSTSAPRVRIPLSGESDVGSLLIAPADVDFGPQNVGCLSARRTADIHNPAGVPATLQSVALAPSSDPGFTLYPPPLPQVIPPGGRLSFEVGVRPPQTGPMLAAVEVNAQIGGSLSTYVAPLTAEGAVGVTREERHSAASAPEVDLLIVLDRTSSMTDAEADLLLNLQAVVQRLIVRGIDFQIGVTTTDVITVGGQLIGAPADRIVTPRTSPDPWTVLSRNIMSRRHTPDGPASEAGLYAAQLALSAPNLTGPNAGLLRPSASLALLFVSDADDQSSPQIGAPSADVAHYRSLLSSIKGFRNPHLLTVSAIVGEAPSGCAGVTRADPAPRYTQLSNDTQGALASICTTGWHTALHGLEVSFRAAAQYNLQEQPIVSSIEVEVNSTLVPAIGASGERNWDYDFNSNAVRFTPAAAPQRGAQVLLRYAPECR